MAIGYAPSYPGYGESPTDGKPSTLEHLVEILADQEYGELYLKVNDVVGAYKDNDGEYRVDVNIIEG